ncbi:hypothetical protein I4F81_001244 [Pyropia yezoensis]|uniref:Uncharacterized protein n=1 Tax=Pyropia yezoensis TaxID=2788 RepID=A0ACC3BLZ1_PYRYE|nr:hypothetical protein I4F81_001244 [Neopyropia yezoensis]
MAAVADELGAALSAAAGPGPPPAAAVAAVTVAVERWVATAVGTPLLAARLSDSPPYPSKQMSLARRHLRPADGAVVKLLARLIGADGARLLHVRLATVKRTLRRTFDRHSVVEAASWTRGDALADASGEHRTARVHTRVARWVALNGAPSTAGRALGGVDLTCAAVQRLASDAPKYSFFLSASRAAWAAAVWRLDGESLVAALAEATACMCGGSASGAPAVDGSYEKAFRALAAATMVAVGLTPPPTGYHIPMRFLRLLEGKAVVVARALFRVNDRPSLDALVAAVATTRPVRLRPLLTDVDLLTVAAPRGVTGPALARLATAIKARVAAGPPEPPPCSWAMSPPRTEVLVAVTGSAAAAAQAAAWYESPLGPSRPMSEDYHDMRYDCAAAAHAAAAQLPPTGNGWTTTVTVSGRKPRAVVRVTTCDAAARRLRQAWEDAQTDARRADAFLAAGIPDAAPAAWAALPL